MLSVTVKVAEAAAISAQARPGRQPEHVSTRTTRPIRTTSASGYARFVATESAEPPADFRTALKTIAVATEATAVAPISPSSHMLLRNSAIRARMSRTTPAYVVT